jgi:hypothetical protein
MTRYLIAGLCLLSIILSSCAGLRLTEEQKLLRELRKWENFSGNGIIELSAMGLSLRKPFSFSKSMAELRLDVIEGGIFGAGASPLLTMYVGEYLAVNAPIMPALELLNLKDKVPAGALALFASSDYIINNYGAEIIANKAIVRDSLSVNFKKNYQLESVVDRSSGTSIAARYTKRGDLDTIEIKTNMPVSARLIFDSVDYSRPQIVPLPPKPDASGTLKDLFQGGGIMDMFKGILGN